jgi:hypothetical protein
MRQSAVRLLWETIHMNRTRALAALLVAFGAVVACSSEDDAGKPAEPLPAGKTTDAGPDDPMNLKWNPTFEPDFNKLEANPAANPVSKTEQDSVTVMATRLEFPAAEGADAKTWEAGRIVVSAPGEGAGANPLGFARRVKSVREENGKVIVETETIGLEDLATGEFQVRFDPMDPTLKDVDLSKIDQAWAGKNLYRSGGVVYMPGSPLTDNFPGARKVRAVPGQPWFWDDIAEAATDVANAVADAAVSTANSIASTAKDVLDELGNVVPKSFSASEGMTDTISGSGNLALFENLNYERTINGKGNLPMKFSIKGNGKIFSNMTFNPGFQVGARIPNYLHPDRDKFQTWVNVDSFAQGNLNVDLDVEAKLESSGGLAGSALEQRLNDDADYAQNVLSQQRETLFGDPDVKPAGGWKKTLYMSKPKTKTFMAGPVPVVLVATVQLDLECGFEAKGTVHTKLNLEHQASFKFKASYEEGGGTKMEGPSFLSQRRRTTEITGGGELMVACGLIPRINTFLYDTVGLNVGVRASMVAKGAYTSKCTSPTSTKPEGNMTVDMSANFGVQIGARFQAPGSSAAGIKGQSAGFDIGPIEPWNVDVPLGSWGFPANGVGYCTPFCRDGKVSLAETDIDCGGGACSSCTTGQKCKLNTDCLTPGSCNNGICKVEPCADRVRNADETDVDCGGSKCTARCGADKGCNQNSDCATGLFCNATTKRCGPSRCVDGVMNGDESGIDCGGASCPKCATGAPSFSGGGCASGNSNGRFCVASPCQNLQRDPGEGGIDCGGTSSCGLCPLGWNCTNHGDCYGYGRGIVCGLTSRRCEKYVVAEPTCTDGVKNGTESDIDCGANCSTKCAKDKACNDPADCSSSNCVDHKCADIAPTGLVFVTSQTFGPQTINGLAGADALCQTAATDANITGTFKAFLSDATDSPATRMTRRGQYRTKEGVIIALSPQEFFSAAHRAPIDVDEKGVKLTQSERVWTGTNGDGTTKGDWCNNWTKPFGTLPPLGLTDRTDSSWASSSAPSFCDAMLRLYCVEQ